MTQTFDYKNRDIGYVYLITNDINGKQYVGISFRPFLRWESHRNATKSRIGKAINFYGAENFTYDIIATSNRAGALQLEAHYCKVYNTLHPNGYNLVAGGRGSRITAPHTDETRAKMSASGKAREPFSETTRKKISEAGKGRKLSAESREKIAASKRGKKHSAETRAKIGLAGTGRKHTQEAKDKISKAFHSRKKNTDIVYEMLAMERGA